MLPRPRPGRVEFVAQIAALMGLNSIAIDIVLPALPMIGTAVGASHGNEAQLVVGAYIIGFGITSLVAGPVADTLGRRRPLLVGIVVYVLATLLEPFAPSMIVLLALRVLQGIGGGTIRISQAVVRDCYSGSEMAAIMSLSMMAFLILPVVAPAIGQGILLLAGWQAIFFVMAASATAIGIWIACRLPETLAPENRRPFTPRSIIEALLIVLRQREALGYGFAAMFLLGALFGFINSAQQIYVGTYRLGVWFPLAFALVALLQSGAAFVNSLLVSRVGVHVLGNASLVLFTAFSALMVACSLAGWMSLPAFVVLMAATMCMFTWADSNLAALAMEPLGEVAGTASSAFGAVQTVGATLLGIVIGQSYDGTATPAALGYLAMGVLALIAVAVGTKGRLFR